MNRPPWQAFPSDSGWGFRNSAVMFRPGLITTILLLTAVVLGAAPVPEAPQTLDRIVSEHVRVRMPAEREWLGHEVIMELERRWQFMNRTIGNMPRRVLLVASWETPETSYDYENATIMIGMDTAAASSDARSYLLHAAGRELARLGLLDLSRGAAAKEECRFLLEGMAKILVHGEAHRLVAGRLQGIRPIIRPLDFDHRIAPPMPDPDGQLCLRQLVRLPRAARAADRRDRGPALRVSGRQRPGAISAVAQPGQVYPSGVSAIVAQGSIDHTQEILLAQVPASL